jgi:hypothetical protein
MKTTKILSSFIYYSGNIWCIFEIHHLLSHVLSYMYNVVCLSGIRLTTLVVIGTDYIGTGSCKSNYHTIMTRTAPGLVGTAVKYYIHLCIAANLWKKKNHIINVSFSWSFRCFFSSQINPVYIGMGQFNSLVCQDSG